MLGLAVDVTTAMKKTQPQNYNFFELSIMHIIHMTYEISLDLQEIQLKADTFNASG